MAALLTNAGSGASGNTALTGESRVIASGNFSGQARAVLTISGDSLDSAHAHTFSQGGAVVISAASGDSLTVNIENGDSNTSIDVSVTAL